MDSPEPVTDDEAWRLAVAYIDAWNRRDRAAWLELLHPELEFRPTALVGTRSVYRGIDGAGSYFDELTASGRADRVQITGLRRTAEDGFLIELELLIEGRSLAKGCFTTRVRDGRIVESKGYLTQAPVLESTGVIPKDAPAIQRRVSSGAGEAAPGGR